MLNHVFRTDIFWFDRFLVGLMEGGVVRPCCKPPHPPTPILLYITSRFAYMKHLFCWKFILIFLYLTSAWMFLFCTLATGFPISTVWKLVFSCWVWKLSKDACPLNFILSASFLVQSDWLEKKVYQSLFVRKEALGTKLMPTVRC